MAVQVLLKQMEQALHALDAPTKRAYFLAKETVEDLVETETPLLHFLRTESYHPTRAAERLARYWTHRHELFGEKWLLPMNQTGTGALGQAEINLVRSGFSFFRIPGTSICVTDLAKAMEFMRKSSLPTDQDIVTLRVAMYIGTAWTDEIWQTQGAILVYLITENAPAPQIRSNAWDMIRNELPARVHSVIVAQPFSPFKDHLREYLGLQATSMIGMCSQRKVVQIMGNSVHDTVKQFQSLGIPPEATPTHFGGTLHYDQALANFTRMRLSLEELSFTSLSPDVAVMPEWMTMTRPAKPRAQPPTLHQDRERRAVYSRRRYHRQKTTLAALQQNVQILRHQREQAQKETKRLQGLLERAQRLLMQQMRPVAQSQAIASPLLPSRISSPLLLPLPFLDQHPSVAIAATNTATSQPPTHDEDETTWPVKASPWHYKDSSVIEGFLSWHDAGMSSA